jgi:hypothetical protein
MGTWIFGGGGVNDASLESHLRQLNGVSMVASLDSCFRRNDGQEGLLVIAVKARIQLLRIRQCIYETPYQGRCEEGHVVQ